MTATERSLGGSLPPGAGGREKIGFIAPMSHLDLTFMGTMEETLSRGCKIVSRALEILDRYKDFCFFLEYMIFVEAFATYHPELVAEVKRRVAEGRLQLGAEWSGIMVTTEEEEDLIRNVLFAKRYVLEQYGVELETLQLTDIPGVVPQLPQVCRGLGIRNVVVTRCAPADRLFWYVGPDGSEVLIWSANGYNQAAAFGSHLSAKTMEEKGLSEYITASAVPPLLYYGSDLYLPAGALAETSAEFSRCNSATPVELTTPNRYFSSLSEYVVRSAPRLSGTMPSTWLYHEPCHANITRLDSVTTGMVSAAERWATIAWLKLGLGYPRQELCELWKALLRARDHNFAGRGAEIGQARKLAERRAVRHRAELVRNQALAAIAERVAVPADCVPVVVFNSLNWPRTDIVKAHVTLYPGEMPSEHDILGDRDELEVRDSAGALVPFQVTADRRHTLGELEIAFLARDVPSLGYAAYAIRARKGTQVATVGSYGHGPSCRLEKWFGGYESVLVAEAGSLRVEVDRLTGKARVLERDGVCWRTLVEGLRLEGRTELPEVVRKPVLGLSFDDPTREQVIEGQLEGEGAVRVLEEGPVFSIVAISSRIGETPCELRLKLRSGPAALDVEADVGWDVRRFGRVELVFEAGERDAQVSYGLPFGASTLAGDDLGAAQQKEVLPGSGPVRSDEAARGSWEKTREICRWLDIGNKERGIAMASDHRWTRVDETEQGNPRFAVRCCLVRGGRMWSGELDNGESSSVPLSFKFRFRPHLGSWRAAGVPREGWEAVHPLVAYTVNDTLSPKDLPASDSMVTASPSAGQGDPIVTCLKQGEDGERVVLRLYESTGEACVVEIGGLLPEGMERVDMLERPLPLKEVAGSATVLRYEARPWEIMTLAGRPQQATGEKVR